MPILALSDAAPSLQKAAIGSFLSPTDLDTVCDYSIFYGALMETQEKVTIHTPFAISPRGAEVLATGWSVKKEFIGEPVHDTNGQEIGTVDDVIVGKEDSLIFAIVGIGGFMGLGTYDVAIEFSRFKLGKYGLLLPDASKETLQGLPQFVYPKAAV